MAVDWSQIFKNPENQAALIKSGFDLAGAAIAGKGAEKQAKYLDGVRRRDAATGRSNDLDDLELGSANSVFAGKQAQKDDADQTVLGAMGKTPLAFQQERASMHGLAEALKSGGPKNLSAHMAPFARGEEFWTEEKLKPFRPSAAAEQPYWDAVATASKGRFAGAGLEGAYGDEGAAADTAIGERTAASGQAFEADWAEHQQVLDDLIANARASNDLEKVAALEQIKSEEKQQSSGGGFWKKLAKIGIMAGAGIATAMTGGAAAPLIGAAAGFGSGAIDGGLKGGLMGAAMGGLSGGLGGGAAGAAKQGLSQAIKSTLSNPATLSRMAGTAIGGPAEMIGQMAAMIPGMDRSLAGPKAPLASRDLSGSGPVVPGALGSRALSAAVPQVEPPAAAQMPAVQRSAAALKKVLTSKTPVFSGEFPGAAKTIPRYSPGAWDMGGR
jgi:hypothetical protein